MRNRLSFALQTGILTALIVPVVPFPAFMLIVIAGAAGGWAYATAYGMWREQSDFAEALHDDLVKEQRISHLLVDELRSDLVNAQTTDDHRGHTGTPAAAESKDQIPNLHNIYDWLPVMKIRFNDRDAHIVRKFFAGWMPQPVDDHYAFLLSTEECEPLFLDCEPEELANCFDTLTRKGFKESVKALFQGDHFYRSDTGKCPRCRRYRPEIHWNNEHLEGSPDQELCDRCIKVLNTSFGEA
ncbi:MAG: hypothetical protein J0H19_12545 [Rhodospirillales bacterium]|nr:hypothetical protein [Rhodospirillales bacterium]MBN8910182.1 hypothetical protein [Rhodospirillales bacterium]MBN8927440.1 hypothetical protein [Rhodospirillales bacterium]